MAQETIRIHGQPPQTVVRVLREDEDRDACKSCRTKGGDVEVRFHGPGPDYSMYLCVVCAGVLGATLNEAVHDVHFLEAEALRKARQNDDDSA